MPSRPSGAPSTGSRGEDDVQVRWAEDEETVAGAVAVREQVFCREQGVTKEEELDGLDDRALHLVAVQTGSSRVVATLRLLAAGSEAKIGRVAVESSWRRRGIAARMLEMALARARELGCDRARLAAQMQATRLYEQAGFAVESGRFEEAGIPHVWMGRDL
ncbi:MAG TPA: MSMEG_0567/Sll0786 family nitrogen starvation N-acetyltransferase [Solirubrobacteraceae bacterium]|jgi:ElaA protein|nr:MSMEG_0567/Sll0786 family nitrogen starvation N-acetyltransferase [Solirubrobacteraceae bacterium]